MVLRYGHMGTDTITHLHPQPHSHPQTENHENWSRLAFIHFYAMQDRKNQRGEARISRRLVHRFSQGTTFSFATNARYKSRRLIAPARANRPCKRQGPIRFATDDFLRLQMDACEPSMMVCKYLFLLLFYTLAF